MGSWLGMDARYPAGTLTPATAFIVALGHMAAATSVYARSGETSLADWLPRHGPDYDHDVLVRAERYLGKLSLEHFLEEARGLLHPEQKLCLALNLLDIALRNTKTRPQEQARFVQLVEGLGLSLEQLQPYWLTLTIKNDLGMFPQ